MNQYNEYSWTENVTCAHNYLLPSLKTLIAPGKLILDAGCGNGFLASKLIEAGHDVYGIDASQSGVVEANRRNSDRFFVQDLSAQELPVELSDKNFNVVISTEVIEHLYDPRQFVRFCKKILDRNGGGELIISTPYHGYLKNLAIALTGKTDAHYSALWDGGHIKFWSRKTLTLLLEEAGFKVIGFKGSGRFPFFWKSMFIKAKC